MKQYNIYLAGGMSNLSYEEQMKWRLHIEYSLSDYSNVRCISPPEYYSFEYKSHKHEREVFEFDLNLVRNSNLIIVNFNKPDSIGTAMEIAVAREHRIPIIGLCEDSVKIHPWLIECCTRMCNTMDELVEHIIGYYLI